MITRLKIDGFKNLLGVDVRLGPFNVIAGPNGVGKSNLFDAIRFLAALADKPVLEAALSVRDDGGTSGDVRGLFHRTGQRRTDRISFHVEMLVPKHGTDDLGQEASASAAFLIYDLILRLQTHTSDLAPFVISIESEDLAHITQGAAARHLLFRHTKAWRDSVVKTQGHRTSKFISTVGEGSATVVKVHQEGHQGRTRRLPATSLPRTVLSTLYAAESPTAFLVRQEMRSWRLLHLDPHALRQSDEFLTSPGITVTGQHLPATLNAVARAARRHCSDRDAAEAGVYARVANRLAELVDDVRSVQIDKDDRRELLSISVTDATGTTHAARNLSDGTLRFLALAVLAEEPDRPGVLCLEEPENGIHPARIGPILQLLQDIAIDTEEVVSGENPLRQVIVNTHSPSVVRQCPDESLLVASSEEVVVNGTLAKGACFRGLEGAWRTAPGDGVTKAQLLAYLNPDAGAEPIVESRGSSRTPLIRRVMDRQDLQPYLPQLGRS